MPQKSFVRQSPALVVLAEQVQEGVGVQAGVLGAHAEHHARAEDTLRHAHLPVVHAVVESLVASHRRRAVAPVGVELRHHMLPVQKQYLVRFRPIIPRPVVRTAILQWRRVGARRRHEAVCRNGLDASVWFYILVSLLATMAAAGAQHTNAHQLMTSRGDGGLKSLAAGLEVVSIMAAAAAQE